jgi:DNA-binding FrmR family transcriptional regulator
VKIAAAMMVGHHANKDALHLRLPRIGGQVRGIQRMVEDEA